MKDFLLRLNAVEVTSSLQRARVDEPRAVRFANWLIGLVHSPERFPDVAAPTVGMAADQSEAIVRRFAKECT